MLSGTLSEDLSRMVGDLLSLATLVRSKQNGGRSSLWRFLGVVATSGNSSFFFFASGDNVKIMPYDTPIFDVLLMIFQSNLQLGQAISRP